MIFSRVCPVHESDGWLVHDIEYFALIGCGLTRSLASVDRLQLVKGQCLPLAALLRLAIAREFVWTASEGTACRGEVTLLTLLALLLAWSERDTGTCSCRCCSLRVLERGVQALVDAASPASRQSQRLLLAAGRLSAVRLVACLRVDPPHWSLLISSWCNLRHVAKMLDLRPSLRLSRRRRRAWLHERGRQVRPDAGATPRIR